MLPETVAAWKSLEGQVIDEKIRLLALDAHERVPVFTADFDGRPVTVRFFHEPDGSTAVFDRHREAAFLTHGSLLPCLGTGIVTLQEGERFTYGVYESPNILLATILEARTFTPEDIRHLCLAVLDGLEFLHGSGLVYCNLDRMTVARCGDRWKLCDYSELRPEGFGYAEETRRLLGLLPGAPPEAFSGVVSPAWDVWSLAHLLRSLVASPPPARSADGTPTRPPRAPELPEPFRTVAAGCLLPDPGARSTIAEIRRQLADQPEPVSTLAPGPTMTAADMDPTVEITAPTVPPPAAAPPPPRDPPQQTYQYAGSSSTTPWDRIPTTRRITPAGILVAAATAVGLLFAVSGYITSHDTTGHPEQSATAQPGEPTRSRQAPEPVTAESEVTDVVNKWAEAFRRNDLDAEMSLYAPRVRRFYLTNNVTPGFVRKTKESALRNAGQIRRYEIDNVNTAFSGPNAATVTFDKAWEFAKGRSRTGKVKGELKLERQNGEWRIVSERDLRVYNQTRSRT